MEERLGISVVMVTAWRADMTGTRRGVRELGKDGFSAGKD